MQNSPDVFGHSRILKPSDVALHVYLSPDGDMEKSYVRMGDKVMCGVFDLQINSNRMDNGAFDCVTVTLVCPCLFDATPKAFDKDGNIIKS